MVIRLADDEHLFTKITLKDLPKNWKEIAAYPVLQEIGNQWYENNTSLVLQVPSVIIPQESNFIVNLNHPDNKKKYISLENTEPFFWDSRLMTGINPASIQ